MLSAKKGLFITIEGPDGSGKSTVMAQLSEILLKNYKNLIVLTREPGGKGVEISEKIRNLVLDKENAKMTAKTEMLLYAASRSQHIEELIIPSLRNGKIVLCDRFVDSSIAYQGAARNIGTKEVIEINRVATNNTVPDLTIILMVDLKTGNSRLSQRKQKKDRLDMENDVFKQKVIKAYEEIIKKNKKRVKVVDATQSLEHVVNEVKEIILNKIKKWLAKN